MITDIIDLFVDVSNTLGSMFESLFTKYRNYKHIISEVDALDPQNVELILEKIPELREEILQSNMTSGYVLISRISFKKNKMSLEIILVDQKYKCIHSFSVLKKGDFPFYNNMRIPTYWSIG